MFEELSTAAVVDAIGGEARSENMACARRLAAIAELYRRREVPIHDGQGRELWRIDPWSAVTAEVAPHHLAFDHTAALSTDPVFKMYPPLRRPEDVAALRAALADGTIDMVGTDHAPHAAHEKDVPFEDAPRGVIGLETAVAVVLQAVGLGPADLFARMALAPARLAGMAGRGEWVAAGGPATITVIDPAVEWVAERFHSRSANSPWRGRSLKGRARHALLRGRFTLRDGEVQW